MTRPKEPPKKYVKQLKDCKTKSERIAAVRQAMKDGHSNKSAAKALGTTSGTIAGIRFKSNIPSSHRSTHAGVLKQRAKRRGKRKPATQEVVAPAPPPEEPESLTPPPPAPEPEPPKPELEPEQKPEPSSFSEGLRPKLAASDFTQCTAKWEDGRQCPFERLPGQDKCIVHAKK